MSELSPEISAHVSTESDIQGKSMTSNIEKIKEKVGVAN